MDFSFDVFRDVLDLFITIGTNVGKIFDRGTLSLGSVSSVYVTLLNNGDLVKFISFGNVEFIEPALINDKVNIELSTLEQLFSVHGASLSEILGPPVRIIVLKHVNRGKFQELPIAPDFEHLFLDFL